jgi:hypothetical protein
MKDEAIKLKSGLDLNIRGIQILCTYDEIIVGEPTVENNIKIFNRLDVPSHWSVRKCVVSVQSFDVNKKKILPYTIYVWLDSNKIVDEHKHHFDGSELVLISTIKNFCVKELIEDVLKDFDWEKYAMNIKI